jgi:hypothetical protein
MGRDDLAGRVVVRAPGELHVALRRGCHLRRRRVADRAPAAHGGGPGDEGEGGDAAERENPARARLEVRPEREEQELAAAGDQHLGIAPAQPDDHGRAPARPLRR